jgi:hypothetical protein
MLPLPPIRPVEARRLFASALRWLDQYTLTAFNPSAYSSPRR